MHIGEPAADFKEAMVENQRTAFTISDCILNCVIGNLNALHPGKIHKETEEGTMISLTCTTAERLEWYSYMLIIVCVTTLVFGFLGNTIVLLNYVHFNKSWTSSGIFLFNLAVCDFMWIIIVPISIYFNLKKPAFYSEPVFCEFKRLLFNVNIYGSIFFLTLISFDRYLCSVHPLTSIRWWNKKKAKVCTVAIWIFIFIESIPDFYYLLEAKQIGNMSACLYYTDSPMSFVIPVKISRFVLGFVVPGTIIFLCYFSSLKVLKQVKDQNLTRKKMNKPLMLISVTMVVFLISYGPYHMMMVILLYSRLTYGRNSEIVSAFYQLSEIICSVSSCANPLIFLLANNKLKHQLYTLKTSIRRICPCQSHRIAAIED